MVHSEAGIDFLTPTCSLVGFSLAATSAIAEQLASARVESVEGSLIAAIEADLKRKTSTKCIVVRGWEVLLQRPPFF